MAIELSWVEFESSIEQDRPARSSKFSSSIEHTPSLDSNSKISIEQSPLLDSTRFEFDRAQGSVRLELDMLDSKSIFRSKCQNYKTFSKIMLNIAFHDSWYVESCPPMVVSFQSYSRNWGVLFSLGVTGREIYNEDVGLRLLAESWGHIIEVER